jgi:phage terminase large subunit GpA-like protein
MSLERLKKEFFETLAPPDELSTAAWAEAHLVLPSNNAEPGRLRLDRTPHLRGIFDAYDNPRTREIYFCAGAQVQKTSAMLAITGRHIHLDPCTILFVLPSENLVEAVSKDRLTPLIKSSDVLSKLVDDGRRSDASNTIEHKNFVGGSISFVTGASGTNLRARPCRVILGDEIDALPDTLAKDGDPIAVVKRRSTTFYNKKHFFASTPTLKKTSKIWRLSSADGVRRHKFWLPCAHCGKYQTLEFEQLRWPGGVQNAYYECPYCKGAIKEGHRSKMLLKGQWRAENPEESGIERLAFHCSSFYSNFVTFAEIAGEYEAAKSDEGAMQGFWNTYLALPWDPSVKRLKVEDVLDRRERYAAEVPAGALFLVAGCDVQRDRIEVQVWGIGRGYEAWAVDYQVLHGDPMAEKVWRDLDRYLDREFEHEWGFYMGITRVGIDSGDGVTAESVWRYTLGRSSRGIFSVKGQGGSGFSIVGRITQSRRFGLQTTAPICFIGVDAAKETIYERIQRPEGSGAGMIHFPVRDCFGDEYFSQLTVEYQETVVKNNVATVRWVCPRGRRNEALDTAVICLWASLSLPNPDFDDMQETLEAYRDGQEYAEGHDPYSQQAYDEDAYGDD